jgi:hypothetical protein
LHAINSLGFATAVKSGKQTISLLWSATACDTLVRQSTETVSALQGSKPAWSCRYKLEKDEKDNVAEHSHWAGMVLLAHQSAVCRRVY